MILPLIKYYFKMQVNHLQNFPWANDQNHERCKTRQQTLEHVNPSIATIRRLFLTHDIRMQDHDLAFVKSEALQIRSYQMIRLA